MNNKLGYGDPHAQKAAWAQSKGITVPTTYVARVNQQTGVVTSVPVHEHRPGQADCPCAGCEEKRQFNRALSKALRPRPWEMKR